jgi:hypothetical protein
VCDDRVTPVLNAILGCVESKFDDCGAPGFCRSQVAAGVVAWDDCCSCDEGDGQLWVRLARWVPDPTYALPGGPTSGCDEPTLLQVAVGALRCVPVVDDAGNAPSSEAIEASAARIYHDTQLIYEAVMCCLELRSWESWESLGSEGGCGGGEHTFQVPFAPCICD